MAFDLRVVCFTTQKAIKEDIAQQGQIVLYSPRMRSILQSLLGLETMTTEIKPLTVATTKVDSSSTTKEETEAGKKGERIMQSLNKQQSVGNLYFQFPFFLFTQGRTNIEVGGMIGS